MIKSMTGYGRFEGVLEGRRVVFEIKAVNHRFLEIQTRLPRACGFLEETVKQQVSKVLQRGKVDVFLTIDADENQPAEVSVNHSLAAGYVKALQELRDRYGLTDDISVSTVSGYSDLFTVHKAPENEEQLVRLTVCAAEEALRSLLEMRKREGEKLREDILSRCETILRLVASIEAVAPQLVEDYRRRLQERISDALKDSTIDPQRILIEAAIFADKTAVDEETVRLRSHIEQLRTMLGSEEAVGRKLDFLVQEMNREANTIGSKINKADLAHVVVDIKSEIEKIREQVQNIE